MRCLDGKIRDIVSWEHLDIPLRNGIVDLSILTNH